MDGRAHRRLDSAALQVHGLGPILSILLLGAVLRGFMLGQDVRFHPDEALYASYARRMSLYGDLLLADEPVDKPPLGLGLTAVSFFLVGPSEIAARLPTALISLMGLAALYAFACRLFGQSTAILAALLLCLSPMDLAFSATAFHDPPLTLWLILAGLCASTDRWRGAGLFAALAIATKQSAVQFIPLYVGVGLGASIRSGWRWHDYRRRLRKFAGPILLCAALLALWSAARAAPVDFWTLGILNPGALRLIRADEVLPRLSRWSEMAGWIVGFRPLLALMLLPVLRGVRLDLLLFGGLLATGMIYWLLSYNLYDRYLHPLGPLALMLIARALLMCPRQARPVVIALAVVCMLPFTLRTVRGEHGFGSDGGLHDGIDQMAATLNALPEGTPVFDHWLGWELRYYLGASPRVPIIWYPTPEQLAREVCSAVYRRPGYFVAPGNKAPRWLDALHKAGISAVQAGQWATLALWRLDCP